jgi:cell division protein ZapA
MAQVTVSIDGKAYRMACEEGQEEHLLGLARSFDAYVVHLKGQFGEIGDLRLTVMAAIMVMDELQEANRARSELEAEIARLRSERDGQEEISERKDEAVATMLRELTAQVRALSAKLDGQPQDSGAETQVKA